MRYAQQYLWDMAKKKKMITATKQPEVDHSPEMAIRVANEALQWARRCGMKGDISITPPKATYYGWAVEVSSSLGRSANARFNREGKPSLWEMTTR
jgi:hypothetical protein